MRVVFAVVGLVFTLLGIAVAFALRLAPTDDGRGIDSTGGWMLVAAGLGLGVVSLLGAPRHTGTIGQRRLTGKSAP